MTLGGDGAEKRNDLNMDVNLNMDLDAMPAGEMAAGEMAEASPAVWALLADGRARLYTLLAQVAGRPVRTELVPYLRAVDLPDVEPDSGITGHDWAVRYEAVLGYGIAANAGAYLNADGMVGGELGARVGEYCTIAGYAPLFPDRGPDHLGNLLACLAHLCAAECDAWADGLEDTGRRLQDLQARLLQDYCLPWLGPLAVALQGAQDVFYTAYAELLVQAIADHWEGLDRTEEADQSMCSIPAPPDAASSGVRELVEFLCLPYCAGIYLSRDDLLSLGRQAGVAAGFGRRSQRLQALLEAVPVRELPHLLGQLSAWAAQWHTAYAELARSYPALQSWIDSWSRRVESTQRLLEEMRGQAQSQLSD